MWNDRTKLLIGKDGVQTLSKSKVAVVGVGGVGGYVAYLLCRAGVENLTLVDCDKVDTTNINRQIVANQNTVGQLKVDVLKKMLFEINPDCKVCTVPERLCQANISKIINKDFDYVVDAIDSLQDKIDLICFCKQNSIPVVSAMGAGNRINVPNFFVTDIYKTSHDGLAKVLRKKLKERDVKSLDVVTTDVQVMKIEKNQTENVGKRTVGSISYFPAMCGCVIAGFVIEKLLKRI